MNSSFLKSVRIAIFLILGVVFTSGMILYSKTREKSNENWKDAAESAFSYGDTKDRKYEKSFTVSEGGELNVEAQAGEVDIQTWDKNEVYVIVELSGTDKRVEKYEVTFNQEGNKVFVRGKVNDNSFFKWHVGNLDARFTIKTPKKFNINTESSGGNVRVEKIVGKVNLKTSGGDVRLNEVEGQVDAETSGGNVEVTNIKGNVEAQTSGGEVRCDNIVGDVRGGSSGGNVEFTNINGKANAKTSGGDVIIKVVGENKGIDAETSGGDISIYVNEKIAATIDAETSGGSVDCDLPVTVKGKVEKSELHGKINGGGSPIRAETSGGDIRIAILK